MFGVGAVVAVGGGRGRVVVLLSLFVAILVLVWSQSFDCFRCKCGCFLCPYCFVVVFFVFAFI